MKILIVKKIKTDLHGTVTLALRLLQYFNKNGHECYLTKYFNSEILDSCGYTDYILPVNEFNISKHAQKYNKLTFDAIYCLTADDTIVGYQLRNKFFKEAGVFVGIYHPKQFMTPTFFLPNYREILHKKLMKQINPENLIFMDEPCLKYHAEYYRINLSSAPIIPLPMEIIGKELSEKHQKNKLFSVGRVTRFKPYPFGVIKAIAALKAKGIYYEYHIIGEGSEYNRLKNFIAELEMSENVVLYGSVPYAKINDLIKDSYCFIGMGTSVGEAAGIGLPALVAIDEDENFCYGLLGKLPNNVLGEQGENIGLINYETALLNLYHLSEEEYKQEKIESINKASFYSTENVANLFLDTFKKKNIDQFKITYFQNLMYVFSKVLIKLFIKKEFKFK